jgi:hypothetical protein
MTRVPLAALSDEEIERLYDAGLISDEEIEDLAHARLSPSDLAILDGIAYGLAKLLHTPINQLASEAASFRADRGMSPGMPWYDDLDGRGPQPSPHPRPHGAAYNKVTRDAAQGNLHMPQYPATKENEDMSAYAGWDYVGADGQSYPEMASRAVRSVHEQSPFPAYGYLRASYHDAKIYRFNALEDAHGWFTALTHGQAPYDYAAVFAATDLSRPVHGLESFGSTTVSGDAAVGNWLPFLLGLPLGALGGYFYGGWKEKNPGKWIPGISGDPSVGGPWLDIEPMVGGPWLDIEGPGPMVGGPWLDIEGPGPTVGGPDGAGYTIGGPWLDIVGAEVDDRSRMRAWPQVKALIQSAMSDVTSYAANYPAEAFVWALVAPETSPYGGRAPGSIVMLEGTTNIVPFSSQRAALDYMREVRQTRPVALALFDRGSSHWPNPTSWTKSDDPAHESIIAQQAAKVAPPRTAGAYVGTTPSQTTLDAAINDMRDRAQSIANKRAGRVIGVIHTVKDNLWHALAFTTEDDADDWLNTATQDQAAYTYAAYFDKNDATWPHPVIEKIGGVRVPPIRRGRGTARDWVGGAP